MLEVDAPQEVERTDLLAASIDPDGRLVLECDGVNGDAPHNYYFDDIEQLEGMATRSKEKGSDQMMALHILYTDPTFQDVSQFNGTRFELDRRTFIGTVGPIP